MHLECLCGALLADTGYPNDTEHFLAGSRSVEMLQHLADDEVRKSGVIDMWPEHWDESGAVEAWQMPQMQSHVSQSQGTTR